MNCVLTDWLNRWYGMMIRMQSGRHFLQSDEWAVFLKKLGRSVTQKGAKSWRYVAVQEPSDGPLGRFFGRLFVPYGPYGISETTLQAALASLEQTAKQLGVDYVRVEPQVADSSSVADILHKAGYHKHGRPFNPPLTNVIDLTQSFDDILRKMSKTNSYLWRKAEVNGITFSKTYTAAQIDDFLAMMQETAERAGAIFHTDDYYRLLIDTLGPTKRAGLAYAHHNGEAVVSALFVDDFAAKNRYYMHAGGFGKARKLSANSPLLTYLIHDAKKAGLERFDLFGVSPIGDESHRWAGISKFKRSFGGQDVEYAGTWEKPIRPLRYSLLSAFRKIAKML